MCKMAHFGNCDPETADQEYCIFHKPDKDEKEAREFYNKLVLKFFGYVLDIKSIAVRKLENFEYNLHFSKSIPVGGTTYSHRVNYRFGLSLRCEKFVFPQIPVDVEFSFKYAIFEKKANFRLATFIGYTTFEGVIFKNEAIFDSAIFKGNTIFEKAQFNGVSRFSDATFEMPAYFENSVFNGNAIFERTEFRRETYFENTTFGKTANFDEIMFFSKANFQKCRFLEDAKFSEAYFELSSDFEGCIFEKSADFSAATFNGYVYFDRTIFKDDVSFEGVTFNEPISFKGKPEEYKYKFYGKLDFSHADIRKGIDIDIPSKWFKLPEAEIEARRVQRISYEKEGKRYEADEMFVLERRTLRKWLKRHAKERFKNAEGIYSKFESFLYLLYVYFATITEAVLADWISRYGTKWSLILLNSFGVIGINAILYWVLSGFAKKTFLGIPIGTIYTDASSQGLIGFLNALYYSLVTFTTLGYGDMHPTGWLKIVSGLEALTGAVFMALIVAVIARKWMC